MLRQSNCAAACARIRVLRDAMQPFTAQAIQHKCLVKSHWEHLVAVALPRQTQSLSDGFLPCRACKRCCPHNHARDVSAAADFFTDLQFKIQTITFVLISSVKFKQCLVSKGGHPASSCSFAAAAHGGSDNCGSCPFHCRTTIKWKAVASMALYHVDSVAWKYSTRLTYPPPFGFTRTAFWAWGSWLAFC